jgi:hypothetical protein
VVSFGSNTAGEQEESGSASPAHRKESHSMKYVRIYADSVGESHFADVDIAVTPTTLGSTVLPLQLSSISPATEYGFIRAPVGWQRTQRPTRGRELYVYLAGAIESEVSDGEVRRFGPGNIALVEDTTGKGHAGRVIGTDDALLAIVYLPD